MKKLISTILCTILLFTAILVPRVNAANTVKSAGMVNTSSAPLNVRSGASTSHAVLTSLPKNSYVTLISKSGNWWKVEYKPNTYGYCSADYLKAVASTPAQVTITSGYLNVRANAGTQYSVLHTLQKGEQVLVLSTSGGWSRILFNGTQTGYVSSQYLTAGSSGSSPANPYEPIRLSVPDYKQTDSRWANTTLGSSGKTIGQIGCTTTCLAMTESFRTGTTIYPNEMAKKLSYSSSGSLYWPSNYVTDTAVSYEKIKSILKSGKPVIVGLQTNSGSTHWVVVTGNLNAKYTVNDPGSNTRQLLSEVLEKYPNFYKIAYYR